MTTLNRSLDILPAALMFSVSRNHGWFVNRAGSCDCSSLRGSAVRVCGLHCLPGDSAPSIRAHTTTKGSLVSHCLALASSLSLCSVVSFYTGHLQALISAGYFTHEIFFEW